MQQICYQRLSVPPLQLRKDAATVGTLRRAPLRACTLKLQASSIHASTDTAEQQQGIGVSSSYQPLTKARKKQHLPTASSDGWQTASKVARYAALAAGAVAAMTALHVDVINATATGAALGIGKSCAHAC